MRENCKLSNNMEIQEKSGELGKIMEYDPKIVCVFVCMCVSFKSLLQRKRENLGNPGLILALLGRYKESFSPLY